jgi:hypothetical protein
MYYSHFYIQGVLKFKNKFGTLRVNKRYLFQALLILYVLMKEKEKWHQARRKKKGIKEEEMRK